VRRAYAGVVDGGVEQAPRQTLPAELLPTTKHVIAQTDSSSNGSGDCWKARVAARRGWSGRGETFTHPAATPSTYAMSAEAPGKRRGRPQQFATLVVVAA
jgi:hypothetical protein